MGDPKRQRKRYSTPMHPWQMARIDDERVIKKDYGLKNKKEIWRMDSKLKTFKSQVKKLIAGSGPQVEKERGALMKKLNSLGLIGENADLSSALGITLKDFMERSLQAVVFRKKLARTIKQARQFITHEHIRVGEKKVTSPSYLVTKDEEAIVGIDKSSGLSNPEHPERIVEKVKVKNGG